jgi:hypothetical protein
MDKIKGNDSKILGKKENYSRIKLLNFITSPEKHLII